MSKEKPEDLKEFAREIYLIFCESAGHEEWDWQKVANTAFDAAEQFETIANQRINPQSDVPTDEETYP